MIKDRLPQRYNGSQILASAGAWLSLIAYRVDFYQGGQVFTGRTASGSGLRGLGFALVLLLLAPLLTACGDTVRVPDVVGMRLDAAHRKFEALQVTQFEDKDVLGEEDTIFRDANWVVVKQSPAAGTPKMDTDTTIKLSVGNEDDAEVLDLIPKDSAFAVEVAEKQAKKAADDENESDPVSPSRPNNPLRHPASLRFWARASRHPRVFR